MFGTSLLIVVGLMSAKTHYLLLFAHQDAPYGQRPEPKTAHSFASWIEVDGDKIEQEFTISWTGIHGVRFLEGPQPARLLDLEQSLARAKRRCLPVTMWGPFRVTQCAYDRAKCMHERLVSGECNGQIQYNVLDWKTRFRSHPQAINCIHVLSDIAARGLRTGANYGITASEFILDEYICRGLILGEDSSAEWVWEALRGEYCVLRRPSCAGLLSRSSEVPAETAPAEALPEN